jgi:hemerythrin-like domain-containing protein
MSSHPSHGQPQGIVTRSDLLQAEPSTEEILIHARCECCGLTRHLSTAAGGHTFCTYCRDEAGDTQPSISIAALAPPALATLCAPRVETLQTHPLASLIEEHRLIGQLAEALSCFAVCIACQSTRHDRADLAQFARVFRDLGDCMHHEKEETVLLPLLLHLGFDWEDGPLADVRRDHCQERYLIDVLCHAAERDGAWSNEDRRRIAATALELGEFQHAHLLKENTELFPVVMQRMSPSELRLLQGELRTFDIRIERHMPRAELTALALDLIRRYLPPAPLVEVPTSFSTSVDG